MKKLCLLFALLMGVICMVGCDGKKPSDPINGNDSPPVTEPENPPFKPDTPPIEEPDPPPIEKPVIVEAEYFDIAKSTVPIWNEKTVYNETVTFVGKDDVAPLTYQPTKIISVYDYYLNTQFFENSDFVLDGKNLKLTEETRIRFWDKDAYYSDENKGAVSLETKDGFIPYSEVIPNTYTLKVCYEHNDGWKGEIPQKSGNLDKSIGKLKNGTVLNVGIVGDGIFAGAGSSEYISKNIVTDSEKYKYDHPTPSCTSIIERFLNAYFAACFGSGIKPINMENSAAIGGKSSDATAKVNSLSAPKDLVVIAFGINDKDCTAAQYKTDIESAIKAAREKNSDCEIILISPMLPNPNVYGYTEAIPQFEAELKTLSATYSTAVVPITSISKYLYENANKRAADLLSNSLNHPTDFVHRIIAQSVLTVMLGDYSGIFNADGEHHDFGVGEIQIVPKA